MPPGLTPPDAPELPIDRLLPTIVDRLAGAPSLVLEAPPGAGKTTRVPPALVASGRFEGRILVLEPRRVATRAAARRIAAEWGWRVGEEVGYRMRFERRENDATRILVMTEGTLLGWLQADPFLEGVSVVVFDEIHERSLDADLGLALCRRVQSEARNDLRLVAMSATLGRSILPQSLAEGATLTSEGRSHPVTIEYAPRSDRRPLEGDVVAGVRQTLDRTEGHLLVFLPGVGEIRRCERALASVADDQGLRLLPLHGSLSSEEQDAVLEPSSRRKVVLATNVAETSITIPGVGAVVDSGLARVLRYDPGRGLDRLELTDIARDSADQRAGRAGRESPGYCLRLWSEREQANRLDHLPPEIQRVDLSGAVLQLFAWGETDLEAFPWIDPPPASSLAAARDLLRDLGALDARGLTATGRAMSRLPVPPRLARLLLAGADTDDPTEVARVAALLAERDPFRRPDREAPSPPPGASDLRPRLQALERFERSGRPTSTPYGELLPGAARHCLRVADQLQRLARSKPGDGIESVADPDEQISEALLAAFPDRVARRRHDDRDRALMVGGRGLRLGRNTAVRQADLFLALAVRAGRRGSHSEAWVDLAVAIDESQLPGIETVEGADVADDGRVRGYRRRCYRDLVLDEVAIPLTDPVPIEAALVAEAYENPGRHLALDDGRVGEFLDRLRSLAHWRPELGLPTFDDDTLRELLPALVSGCRSLDDVAKGPRLEVLSGLLTADQSRSLRCEAPTHVELANGRRKALRYEAGRPPILAARIQELFGMTETPRVAGGRVAVLLHLLAPNFRPQQITDDLAGFWADTYADVRRELRGRYPKHDWPEDPTADRNSGRSRET